MTGTSRPTPQGWPPHHPGRDVLSAPPHREVAGKVHLAASLTLIGHGEKDLRPYWSVPVAPLAGFRSFAAVVLVRQTLVPPLREVAHSDRMRGRGKL